jgi:hypothetical protein
VPEYGGQIQVEHDGTAIRRGCTTIANEGKLQGTHHVARESQESVAFRISHRREWHQAAWRASKRGQTWTQIASPKILQRFATEDRVVDDSLVTFEVAKDGYWHFPLGSKIEMRLVHIFEMQDGKIAREIVFDMGRPV